MQIVISTQVAASCEQVWRSFDGELFKALSPAFPRTKVLRFDGSQTGDEVHLELDFLLFKQHWKSLITESKRQKQAIYFVDEGIQLPFFIKQWRHLHKIACSPRGAVIIDDITFTSPWPITDYLLYPLLYLQFLYRKPVYKRLFGSRDNK